MVERYVMGATTAPQDENSTRHDDKRILSLMRDFEDGHQQAPLHGGILLAPEGRRCIPVMYVRSQSRLESLFFTSSKCIHATST